MNKTLPALAAAFLLFSSPLVAQTTGISNLQNGLSSFVTNAPPSLPFAASAGLDWSDAYIGQLVDTSFPWVHLGVGFTGGVTSLPNSAINPLLEALGQADVSSVGLPFTAFNLRLGGLVWPFDMGLKIGFLPPGLVANGLAYTYSSLGFDVRYNLLKDDLLWPNVSVGGGVNYMSAVASGSYGNTVTYSDGQGNTLILDKTKLDMKLSSLEFEARAQVSKKFLFILTPYLGLTAFYGTGHAEAAVTTTATATNGLAAWQQYIPGITNTGFSKTNDQGSFGMKIWGGTSFDVFAVKFDFQGMYSLFNGAYGGAAGVRIQL